MALIVLMKLKVLIVLSFLVLSAIVMNVIADYFNYENTLR